MYVSLSNAVGGLVDEYSRNNPVDGKRRQNDSEISLGNVKKQFGGRFARESSVRVNVHDEVQLDILSLIESTDDADGPFGDDVMLEAEVSTTHCSRCC